MPSLADYKKAKADCKAAGLDVSALDEDFKDKVLKVDADGKKLDAAEAAWRASAEKLLKSATAYKMIAIKWQDSNRADEKKAKAADKLGKMMELLERELRSELL